MFKILCRNKDTGKTKELLNLAHKENATVITSSPRALKVKASSLGYNKINIINWQEFISNDLVGEKIIIDNAEEVLREIIYTEHQETKLIAMAVNTDAYT